MIASFSSHAPTRKFSSQAGGCTVYCNGAIMRAYCRNEITVVQVTGEVDATNVDRVYDYIHRFVSEAPGLILNLRDVDFLCARGIFVLHAVGNKCRTEGRRWAIVTSPAVKTLLKIGDPHGKLPTADSERLALISIAAQHQAGLAAS